MLSSLGARRDRSRSPSEGRPPSKVFIQDEEKAFSQQRHDSLVPKIVVQEYSEETVRSSPSSSAPPPMKEGIAGARDLEMAPQQQEQQVDFTAPERPCQYEQQQLEQHHQMFQCPEYCEQTSSQEQPPVKLPLSPQELQSRKAKAVKNRPWLQKPASGEHAPPHSSQANTQSMQAQPESGRQQVPQQMSEAEEAQQKPMKLGQIQSEEHQKEPKKKDQKPQLVRRRSGPSGESKTAPFPHPPQKKRAQNQSQVKVAVQASSQVPGASPEVASSPTDGQQAPTMHVPAEPQVATPSQALLPEPAIAHAQIWARVRPSSPMQASLHGHIQPPVPAHIQLRSHAQSWAPVRPPSPKPPAQPQSPPQTAAQPQGQYSDWFSQSQSHSVAPPQPFDPHVHSRGQSPLQPWVADQESPIQAVPQQQLPISQPYPQQGYPAGSVPPQWPQLGPQVGAPGTAHVDRSYTQPCMQTEVLPQALPWNSMHQQPQVKGSGLFHPDQVQQLTWVQPSSQHQPQAFSHPQPQTLLQPPTQQPSQKALLTEPPAEAQLVVHTQPQIRSSESPENIRPPAQLLLQAEVQSPVQSVVAKTKPQLVTEPSFPSKAELLQPGQLVQTAPVGPPAPSQVTSPPHPKDQTQDQDPQNRIEVPVGGAPSLPEYQLPPHPQLQSPGHPEVVSPTQPTSPPQPRAEGQVGVKPPTPSPPQARGHVAPQRLSESPDLCVSPLTLSQAPPQAYTEAYAKAQALARNGFEEAKHCLQEHIRETISVFEDKSVSADQVSLKEVKISVIHSVHLTEVVQSGVFHSLGSSHRFSLML